LQFFVLLSQDLHGGLAAVKLLAGVDVAALQLAGLVLLLVAHLLPLLLQLREVGSLTVVVSHHSLISVLGLGEVTAESSDILHLLSQLGPDCSDQSFFFSELMLSRLDLCLGDTQLVLQPSSIVFQLVPQLLSLFL
jgi:hypothetical protein